MIKTVIGSFDSASEATNAARELRTAGFMDSDVNVIANNVQPTSVQPTSVQPTPASVTTTAPDDSQATAEGAIAGGALGGAAGLAVGLMGLAIPGIGPIIAAGPIVAALAGAGAGAVAGGLIGSLTELGIPEADAHRYAEAVRRGAALVTIRADASRADEAESILSKNGAFNVEDRVEVWRKSGWHGYDPDAAAFTYDEIERDRSQYFASARNDNPELRR